MLAKTASVAIVGTEAHLVDVEIHVGVGLPTFSVVGLPTKTVREAEQRTRAALESSGEKWPQQKIIANLAPGGLRKEGTHFDLAIALGVLAADEKLDPLLLNGWVMMGELGLDGVVRPVRGALAAALTVAREGKRGLICPVGNAAEASLVEDLTIVPVASLSDCKRFLQGELQPDPVERPELVRAQITDDISEVRGHTQAKAALEVAAAGGHNLLVLEMVTPV